MGPVPSRDTTIRVRLAALAVSAGALVMLTYVIAIRTVRGQKLDDAAWFGHYEASARASRASRAVLETIGISSLAIALLVLVVVAFGRRRPRLALVVGCATFGANATTQVLKHVLLSRPSLLEDAPRAYNTYPSGHSTVAMSVAVAAVLVAPRHWRSAVGVVGFVYATAVGVSTMVVGWHRPSDVIGGFAVATGTAAAGALVLVVWRGASAGGGARREPAPHLATLLAAGGVVLIAAAAAVLVGFVGRSDELFVLDGTRAFVAAVGAISATAALLGAGLLGALRAVTLDPPVVDDDPQARDPAPSRHVPARLGGPVTAPNPAP